MRPSFRVETDRLRSVAGGIADQADEISLATPEHSSEPQVGHARLAGRLETFLDDSHRGVSDLVASVYDLGRWLVNAADEVEALDAGLAPDAPSVSDPAPTHPPRGNVR